MNPNKKNIKKLKRLKSGLQKKTQNYEKEIFDLKQLLEVSKTLNSHLEFNRVIESILYAVMAQLKTLQTAVFTKKSFDDEVFVLHKNYYGFEKDNALEYVININNPFLKFLDEENRCITPAEVIQQFGNDSIIKQLLLLGPSLFVPLKAKNTLEGFLLLGDRIVEHGYTDYEYSLIMNIASFAAVAINNSQLIEMTTTDMMTRLKQKHYFFSILSEKIETLNEMASFSVLMVDIDFFKNINDTYGHACGDIVLQNVAQILKSCVRENDMTARYGGEEFVIALFNMNASEAKIVADRILKKVESTVIKADSADIKVTVSIGIAEYLHNTDNAKKVVERADIAMYQSKQNGRNRITVSKENLKIAEN